MKHVVITGASRGLGRAMAIDFTADGWTVSGCGTDAAALQSLQSELGPDHLLHVCDITDPASVEKLSSNAATISTCAHHPQNQLRIRGLKG